MKLVQIAAMLSLAIFNEAQVSNFTAAQLYRDVCIWQRKVIFSTGPVTTNVSVKKAMLMDHSSTGKATDELMKVVTKQILEAAEVSEEDFIATILQGSTTFAIEAAVNSATPKDGKWLILSNGYYGVHLHNITSYSGKKSVLLTFNDSTLIDPLTVERHLQTNPNYTGVAIVHLESSTGAVNDIAAIGKIVKQYLPDAFYLVDGASSFTGIPLDLTEVDFFISTPSKVVAAPAGVGIIIAKKRALERIPDTRYSYVLDLHRHFEDVKRHTIPLEVVSALSKALNIFKQHGGIQYRSEMLKYKNSLLRKGMKEMGFKEYLNASICSYIITSFKFPSSSFSLKRFSDCLEDNGKAIFNFVRPTLQPTFRLGNMGEVTEEDIKSFLLDIQRCMKRMGYQIPLS